MTGQPIDFEHDLDDLAAELDDDDNDPAGDDAQAERPEALHYHAGLVVGGPQPYPGRLLVSRFPSGVLLADRPSGTAWVLDYDPAAGVYRCRDDAGAPLDEAGRWRAAEGPTYEVRAYDDEFDGDLAPGTCEEPGCDDPAPGVS